MGSIQPKYKGEYRQTERQKQIERIENKKEASPTCTPTILMGSSMVYVEGMAEGVAVQLLTLLLTGQQETMLLFQDHPTSAPHPFHCHTTPNSLPPHHAAIPHAVYTHHSHSMPLPFPDCPLPPISSLWKSLWFSTTLCLTHHSCTRSVLLL